MLNCLIKNTQLKIQLEELINDLMDNSLVAGKVLSPTQLYDQIKNLGVEVDLSSIGFIYQENYSGTQDYFLTMQEVEDNIGQSFNNQIQNVMANSIAGKEEKIGKESPVEAVMRGLTNLFNANKKQANTKSVMKDLQDIMLRSLRNKLQNVDKATVAKMDYTEIIEKAFDNISKGFDTVSGTINGLNEIFDDVKKEIDRYTQEMKDRGATASEVAKFENAFNEIRNSTFDLALNTTDSQKIINGALAEVDGGKFTKVDKDGVIQVDWNAVTNYNKTSTDLAENVRRGLQQQGSFTDTQIDAIIDSMQKELVRKHEQLLERNEKELVRKGEKSKTVNTKSDIQRLARINAIGKFDNASKKAIEKLVGVSDLDSEIVRQLEAIGDAINAVMDIAGTNTNPQNVATVLSTFQNQINRLVALSINDKSNSFLGVFQKYYRLYQEALGVSVLQNTKNMIQNVTSGAFANNQASLEALIELEGNTQVIGEARKIFWATFRSVAFQNGQEFGTNSDTFGANTGLNQSLKGSIKDFYTDENIAKATAKTLAKILFKPFHVLGTSVDSAIKASIQHKMFVMSMNIALKKLNPNQTQKQRNIEINNMLYGKSFEDAKTQARQIITASGQAYSKQLEYRVASEIVRNNVENGLLTSDHLDAMLKSSYSVAGMSLGHENQNTGITTMASAVSAPMLAVNYYYNNAIEKAIKKEEYDKVQFLKIVQTFANSTFFRFLGGATKWMVLELDKTGLGIVRGVGSNLFKDNTLPTEKKEMQEYLTKSLKNKSAIGRGVGGLALSMIVGLLLNGDKKCPDGKINCKEEEKLNRYQRAIKNSKNKKGEELKDGDEIKKIVDKFLPTAFVLSTAFKSEDEKVVDRFFNINDKFSNIQKLYQAALGRDAYNNALTSSESKGLVGQAIFSGSLGTPAWQGIKISINSTNRLFYGEDKIPQDYATPTTLLLGALDGGMLEDLGQLNTLKKDSPVDGLAGIGEETSDRLKSIGINSIKELEAKKNNLQTLTFINKKGKRQKIFTKSSLKKVNENLKRIKK